MASCLELRKQSSDDLSGSEQLTKNMSMDQVAQLVHAAPPGFQMQPPQQLSLSQLRSLGSSVMGWQVLVRGAEGSFVGYLCWMLDHCSRLGLEQASRLKTGVQRLGVLLLSYRHVTSVALLGRRANLPHSHAKSAMAAEKLGRSLVMKKLVTPDDDDDDGGDQSDEEIPPLPPPAMGLCRPSSWSVVDAMDESYQEAVSAISKEPVVGLSAVGHNLGRWGTLVWLALATQHTVFLFDAASLGLQQLLLGHTPGDTSPCLGSGNDGHALPPGKQPHNQTAQKLQHNCLKDVLQDPHLEVVVHDSRNLQDFLKHKAGFTINALFDTQATEVYLHIIQHGGDCPAFVPSLSSLLQQRVGLAPQHLLYEKTQRRLAENSSAYLERPLDARTLQGIASSAAFLCELRALQLRDVLADLRQLTALHGLSHALTDDLLRSRVEERIVPTDVQRLGRQTVLSYRGTSSRSST